MTRQRLALASICAGTYALLIVFANWLVARFGFVYVAPHLLAPAGTYAVGVIFVARALIQETAGRWWVLAAIGAGAALSWVVASPRLAVASGVTFLVSETLDWGVYTKWRARGWRRAAGFGNAAGLVADSFLFLWLAGFPLFAVIGGNIYGVPGQVLGKTYGTIVYLLLGSLAVRRVARLRVAQ
jgi:uncharacterized PurR-regulated membrane protein YhhQ (DUF165 family)